MSPTGSQELWLGRGLGLGSGHHLHYTRVISYSSQNPTHFTASQTWIGYFVKLKTIYCDMQTPFNGRDWIERRAESSKNPGEIEQRMDRHLALSLSSWSFVHLRMRQYPVARGVWNFFLSSGQRNRRRLTRFARNFQWLKPCSLVK